MTESGELDAALPNEDEEVRWLSGAKLVVSGAIVICAALGYFFYPRASRSASPSNAPKIAVTLLRDPSPRSFPAARAIAQPAASEPAATPTASRDFRNEAGLPTNFLNVVRLNNAKAFVGRLLRFDSVNVVSAPTLDVVSIGADAADSVLVRLDSAISRPHGTRRISPGEKLFLVGRLMPEPTAEKLRSWGLRPEDLNRVRYRAVYIRAVVVDTAASGAPASF